MLTRLLDVRVITPVLSTQCDRRMLMTRDGQQITDRPTSATNPDCKVLTVKIGSNNTIFLQRDGSLARLHSAALVVVRCLSITFVYCVETAKVTATAAMECEGKTVPKVMIFFNVK